MAASIALDLAALSKIAAPIAAAPVVLTVGGTILGLATGPDIGGTLTAGGSVEIIPGVTTGTVTTGTTPGVMVGTGGLFGPRESPVVFVFVFVFVVFVFVIP